MPPRPWRPAGGCSPVVMHEIGGRHDCDRADVAGSARALRVPPGSADGVDQAAYAAFGEVGVAGGAGRDGRDRDRGGVLRLCRGAACGRRLAAEPPGRVSGTMSLWTPSAW